jgi:hypothetical protein
MGKKEFEQRSRDEISGLVTERFAVKYVKRHREYWRPHKAVTAHSGEHSGREVDQVQFGTSSKELCQASGGTRGDRRARARSRPWAAEESHHKRESKQQQGVQAAGASESGQGGGKGQETDGAPQEQRELAVLQRRPSGKRETERPAARTFLSSSQESGMTTRAPDTMQQAAERARATTFLSSSQGRDDRSKNWQTAQRSGNLRGQDGKREPESV